MQSGRGPGTCPDNGGNSQRISREQLLLLLRLLLLVVALLLLIVSLLLMPRLYCESVFKTCNCYYRVALAALFRSSPLLAFRVAANPGDFGR